MTPVGIGLKQFYAVGLAHMIAEDGLVNRVPAGFPAGTYRF